MRIPLFLNHVALAIFLGLGFSVRTASAELRVPHLFSDHMVVQRGRDIPVWGWATPGDPVKVAMGDQAVATAADPSGAWRVSLKSLPAGGPYTLTIGAATNVITCRDVMVGEVWVCSGQSWMTWNVGRADNAAREIEQSEDPLLRMFTVPLVTALTPQADGDGNWAVSGPKTVAGFSAAGYFFARELRRVLGVPVGMIHASAPGTMAQAWTSRPGLEAHPKLKPLVEGGDKRLAEFGKTFCDDYGVALRQWLVEVDQAKAAGKSLPMPPEIKPLADPRYYSQHVPSLLYNAMIAPLTAVPISGFIWYQGGAEGPDLYRELFPAMIRDWRRNWGQGDLPFLFVQRANLNPEVSGAGPLPEFREAQAAALALTNTGMAVATDIGLPNDLHPTNMQETGRRLALLAQVIAYRKDIVGCSPFFDRASVETGKVRLRFNHAKGLAPRGGPPLKGFEVAGEDGVFAPAAAATDGDTVCITYDPASKVAAVRYNWTHNPNGNLVNSAGLPAAPFKVAIPQAAGKGGGNP